MRPKFSIITPSYNRADFITQTITSVLTQEYDNLEYIVIDGDSTDSTSSILDAYTHDARFSYISEPDSGMYDAINKGLSRASGDIIAYINTDDYYFPWTLDVVAKYFMEHEHVDMVYGDSMVCTCGAEQVRLNMFIPTPADWLRACLLFAQPTVFIRRRAVEAVGMFAQDVRLVADCEYWVRLCEQKFVMRKINEFLAVETNHPATLRDQYAQQIEAEKAFIFDKYSRGIYRLQPVRKAVLTAEALARVLLYLVLIGKSRGFFPFIPWWTNFLQAYRLSKSWSSFLREKMKLGIVLWDIHKTDSTKLR